MLVNTSTLKSNFLNARPINDLIAEAQKVATSEASALAAWDGGYRLYSSREDITRAADADRQDIATRASGVISDAKSSAGAYLDSVYELKPETASQLAPLLSARLSDADLRGLAKAHPDYTALRLLAGVEGSEFAEQLGKRLDQYRESVDNELTRCLRLAERAVTRTPKETSLFNARSAWGDGAALDVMFEHIDSLNADLDASIEGREAAQKPASGLMGALMSYE